MTSPSDTAPAPRLLRWGVAASILLVLAGAALFAAASMRAGANRTDTSDAVTVTLRDGACQPNALQVPAGRSTFRIENRTDRAVEWEILDGVMVVEERENIAPGLSQTLSARLSEGSYAITCGLLSNPRGTLTVTAAAAAPGETARPALTAFIGPLAEYQVYLAVEGNRVVKTAEALDAAIRAGDLEAARRAYPAARVPYLHVEPVAARLADLRDALDPPAAYLAAREGDPAFTGYHRLEYGLFAVGSLDGLQPVSARLVADAAALKDRLRALRVAPDEMANGAVRSLRAAADTRIEGGGSYSKGDLAEIEAQLDGVRRIATLLEPVAAPAAPEALADTKASLAAVDAALDAARAPGGAPSLGELSTDRRAGLASDLRRLADALERLNGRIGLAEGGA